MSNKPDGGPFHPIISTDRDNVMFTQDFGATLRDWFAGQALAALIASDSFNWKSDESPAKALSRSSYEYADAMIEARAK